MTNHTIRSRQSLPSRSPSASFNLLSSLPEWAVAVGHTAMTAGFACYIGGMTAGALILGTTFAFCKLVLNREQPRGSQTRSAPRGFGLRRP